MRLLQEVYCFSRVHDLFGTIWKKDLVLHLLLSCILWSKSWLKFIRIIKLFFSITQSSKQFGIALMILIWFQPVKNALVILVRNLPRNCKNIDCCSFYSNWMIGIVLFECSSWWCTLYQLSLKPIDWQLKKIITDKFHNCLWLLKIWLLLQKEATI